MIRELERFIPACAGNSPESEITTAKKPVHPRVCGEQAALSRLIVLIDGSSPRVRGTGCRQIASVERRRFIPACAGNRRVTVAQAFPRAVHPRVCGEQPQRRGQARGISGSSPRVRGTDLRAVLVLLSRRFIPACAGNSSASRVISPCRSVHPRVCGEQHRPRAVSTWTCGSSPRVRGTVVDKIDRHFGARFIPACAGNSPNTHHKQQALPVHPRVCGEQQTVTSGSGFTPGSSPRVRGTAPRL